MTSTGTDDRTGEHRGGRWRYLSLFGAATMGVYALIIAGATTAITDASRACPAWPGCGGRAAGTDPAALVIVWSHRLAAVLVALLVVALAVAAWRRDEQRRVRLALGVALALYPVQVVLGAGVATDALGGVGEPLHMTVGVTIFGALIIGLAWALESEPTGLPTGRRDDDGAATTATGDPHAGVVGTVRAYVRMTKPRLMWLLCLVAAAGMALAAGPALTARTVALTLTGGVLAIGASGTFNHVLERDRDQQMDRTADRPVATDQIPPRNALAFGVLLTAASLGVFLQVNALAAALGLVAILFYSVVYTLLLKPNTVQNTVIGGFAGALPAMIGAAAATESVGLAALGLGALVFAWTPAHFYNLALAYRDDYERAGYPMLPVVRGERVTRKHVLLYLGATLVAAIGIAAATRVDVLFAATSVAVGAVFLWAVVAMHREHTRDAVFRAFHASNAYLGASLVAIVVDALAV